MAKLNERARNMVKWAPLLGEEYDKATIIGFVRHYFPDGKWRGDACGCVDDRCIGHHHSAESECTCVEGWVDDYLAVVASDHRKIASR